MMWGCVTPDDAGDLGGMRRIPKLRGIFEREEIAMKTTEHGIEDSRDVENVHHMRLMALLQELVRERGYKGAARVLEIDPQTVAQSAKTGSLSRRVRDSLERALQEGVGSAAERQRRRNEQLEGRIEALEKGQSELEKGQDELGKELRRRLATVEGEIAALRLDDGLGNGSQADSARSGAEGAGGRPPLKRREYPDLATLEPADGDEEVFGEAWNLIREWRGLKAKHPNEGRGLAWLRAEERLMEVELALLEEHGLTLPPEKQPLRGLDRSGQIDWRRAALSDTRRARRRWELLRRVGRFLTFRLWPK